MRLGKFMALMLTAGLGATPVAAAVVPSSSGYWSNLAGSQRPRIVLDVSGSHGSLMLVGAVRCLHGNLMPERGFTIRRGQFRLTLRLGPRGARDQLVIQGRWKSPYTVVGRLRLVLTRAQVNGRRLYCDSGWQQWRSASTDGFGVRADTPDDFAIPGTLTTTVTVYNYGDYASRATEVTLLPATKPARPTPVISTTQGSCRWPTNASWASRVHGVDTKSAILCNLGRVRTRTHVTITITENWSVSYCGADLSDVFVPAWDTFLRSPLLNMPTDNGKWHPGIPTFSTSGRCRPLGTL